MQINLTDKKNRDSDTDTAPDSQTALMNISAGENLPMVTPRKDLAVVSKPKLEKVDELLKGIDLSKVEADERDKLQQRVELVTKELEANPDFPKDKIQAVVKHLLDSAATGDLLLSEMPEQDQSPVPATPSTSNNMMQTGGTT